MLTVCTVAIGTDAQYSSRIRLDDADADRGEGREVRVDALDRLRDQLRAVRHDERGAEPAGDQLGLEDGEPISVLPVPTAAVINVERTPRSHSASTASRASTS